MVMVCMTINQQIMAAIAAAEAASHVTETCVAHVYIPASFQVYVGFCLHFKTVEIWMQLDVLLLQ